jgi:hypothetical protein
MSKTVLVCDALYPRLHTRHADNPFRSRLMIQHSKRATPDFTPWLVELEAELRYAVPEAESITVDPRS